MDSRPTPGVSQLQRRSCTEEKKVLKPSLASGRLGKYEEEENDGEDKWCALNDSKPDTVKRRVRRVIRTSSDSDLSEASTIDSAAGMSAKGTTRKDEIRARKDERKARQVQRKEAKDAQKSDRQNEEELDEDEELVDTDKDLPISEELELALRKQRLEARRVHRKRRGKSPHLDNSGRVRSNRRAGKKEDILSSPGSNPGDDRSYSKSASSKRANSLDGVRHKKKNEGMETSWTEDPPQYGSKLVRSASADRIRRNNSLLEHMVPSSGFNMLLDDSQNDSMLKNTMPLRHAGNVTGDRDTSSLSQGKLCVESDCLTDDLKERGYSDCFDYESPQPQLSKAKISRGDFFPKSGKSPSDRFLCSSKTTDFAPRIHSRRLNTSEHDKAIPSNSLENIMKHESGKIRKMKKGGARSLDDVQNRSKSKQLRQ